MTHRVSTQWVLPGQGDTVQTLAYSLGLDVRDDRKTSLAVISLPLSAYSEERVRHELRRFGVKL